MAKLFGKKPAEEVPQTSETAVNEAAVTIIEQSKSAVEPVKVSSTMGIHPPVSFNDYANELIRLHLERQGMYGSSPVDELSVSAWKYQIQIKATRALRAASEEKLRDELLDTATYCLLLLEKLSGK